MLCGGCLMLLCVESADLMPPYIMQLLIPGSCVDHSGVWVDNDQQQQIGLLVTDTIHDSELVLGERVRNMTQSWCFWSQVLNTTWLIHTNRFWWECSTSVFFKQFMNRDSYRTLVLQTRLYLRPCRLHIMSVSKTATNKMYSDFLLYTIIHILSILILLIITRPFWIKLKQGSLSTLSTRWQYCAREHFLERCTTMQVFFFYFIQKAQVFMLLSLCFWPLECCFAVWSSGWSTAERSIVNYASTDLLSRQVSTCGTHGSSTLIYQTRFPQQLCDCFFFFSPTREGFF